MRVMVPPLRVELIAAWMVSSRPTASRATSTPEPVRRQDLLHEIVAGDVKRLGSAEGIGEAKARRIDVGNEDAAAASCARGLQRQQSDHPGADDEGGFSAANFADLDGVQSYGDRLEHGGLGEGHRIGQPVDNLLRHGYIFGEGSVTPVFTAGNANDLAAIAKVHLSAEAERARAAEDRGVKGDAIAGMKSDYAVTDSGDDSRCFVTHHDRWNAAAGGTIVAVHVAAANAACGHLNEEFAERGRGLRQIEQLQMLVLAEQQRLHASSVPR